MKFSIITITYNRGNLIDQTIQSVINQSYNNFEYIIIDDGSNDNTEEVVKNFNDERIKYYKQDRLSNLSKLTNIGIKKSSGELIAILDSDDLWHESKLEKIIEIFKKNQAINYVTHNIQYFIDKNKLEKPFYKTNQDFFKESLNDVLTFKMLPFPIAVFKKELLNTTHLFNEIFFDGQQDFLLRVASENKIYFIAECLTYMRIHVNNTSKKVFFQYYKAYYISVFNLAKKHKISWFQFFNGSIKISIDFIRRFFS